MQSSTPPVTSYILGPKVHLKTHFSDSLNTHIRDQFYSRTNQQHKLQFCIPWSLFSFGRHIVKTKYPAPNNSKHSINSICHLTAVSVTRTHIFHIVGISLKLIQCFGWSFEPLPLLRFHLQTNGIFENKTKSKTKFLFGVTFNEVETTQKLWYDRF